MQGEREDFVAWGKACMETSRSIQRQIVVTQQDLVLTASDRLQAEWERKRVMRGEAANYQRGRR